MILSLSNFKNIPVKIFRDDLFPDYYGGNKARKIIEIEKDIVKNKCNAVVTTGGIQSNHCRVVALMAAKNSWNCKIIYHGEKERFHAEGGNAKIVRSLNFDYEFVDANDIGLHMDLSMENYKHCGLKPYYIYGGGHNIHGAKAYLRAVQDLYQYSQKVNWKPSYIFLPSGTGSTQAGIMAGLNIVGWHDVKVIGISIARKNPGGKNAVKSLYDSLLKIYFSDSSIKRDINFVDDYILGGYEKTTHQFDNFLKELIVETGIIFDKTYSGKAYYGMIDFIKKHQIRDEVLFWHTGGIFNFLAQ